MPIVSLRKAVFTGKDGQYIRLVALSEVNGNQWTHIAELNVLGWCPGISRRMG
ncbi:MAG: hypothetical protein HS127_09325 [Planctomycetia bacterium]|nr:hypothetical protein [Planctomycetia bacterium]